MADSPQDIKREYKAKIETAKTQDDFSTILSQLEGDNRIPSNLKGEIVNSIKSQLQKVEEKEKAEQAIKQEATLAKEKEPTAEEKHQAKVEAVYKEFNKTHEEALKTHDQYNSCRDDALKAIERGEEIPEATKKEMERLNALQKEQWRKVLETEKTAQAEIKDADKKLANIDQQLSKMSSSESAESLTKQKGHEEIRKKTAEEALGKVEQQYERMESEAAKILREKELAEQNKDKNPKQYKLWQEQEQVFSERYDVSPSKTLLAREMAMEQLEKEEMARQELEKEKKRETIQEFIANSPADTTPHQLGHLPTPLKQALAANPTAKSNEVAQIRESPVKVAQVAQNGLKPDSTPKVPAKNSQGRQNKKSRGKDLQVESRGM